MRKPRAYEAVCRCGKYKFPHRMFGGRCNGMSVVSAHFNQERFGECTACALFTGSCDVLNGLEKPKEAPCLQAFVDYEGLRFPLKWQEKPRSGGMVFHAG